MRRPGLTFWLVIGAIAAMLCCVQVHAEPHGDLPSGWSLEEAPPPDATLEQDDECGSTN